VFPAEVADVEARWNGGAWETIATSGGDGSYSGALSGKSQGQGTLEVRLVGKPYTSTFAEYVGIGDIFVLAGQSNSEGYGTNNQVYSHATLKATKYTGVWAELTDPTDPDGLGSPWPLLATHIMADQNVPVAFVPCGITTVGITTWQPGQANYVAMKAKVDITGAKVVLWHQGEREAKDNMLQPAYNAYLDTLANEIMADFGVKIMPCKLEDLSQLDTGYNEAVVNAAIAEAGGDNANVLTGPDFSDITPSVDGVHFKTDGELEMAAERWWAALDAAFYT